MAAVLALVAVASARLVEKNIAMVTESAVLSEHFELLGNSLMAQNFKSYAVKYNKAYNSGPELLRRFATFLESAELVEKTNTAKLPYTLALNEFADMTFDEFKASRLSAPQTCSATKKGGHVLSNRALPTKKDWREEGIVTPVKNQAGCGSCWAFSTVAAIEAAWKQKTGEEVLLAEQQLVDCAGDYNNFGCSGGLPSQAFQYIKYVGGLDTAESYPYTGVDGKCLFSKKAIGATIVDGVNITSYDEGEQLDALAFARPVSIAYEVAADFRLYNSGVYTSTLCRSGSDTVNHAVLAVGYVLDSPIPYYIVKNSWGTAWGEEGYFNIELGKNMCGVAVCSSYPVV